jgi:tetratricopeptide (TPR) repeat protein
MNGGWVVVVAHFIGVVLGASSEAVILRNGARFAGEIIENDERGVRIRVDGGKEMRFDPNEVKSIETSRSPRHQLGQSSLDRRDFDTALSELRQARDEEKRGWAQQEIDRLSYRALLGKGELEQAGKLYLTIAESRTDLEWLGEAPLFWAEEELLPASGLAAARGWLHDERPLARLIAGSWLIGTAQHDDAKAVLDELQTLDARIGGLARGQLWRAPVTPPKVEDLLRWKLSVSRLPVPLRAGPLYVLAVSQSRAGLAKEAAISYLQVAYIYRPDSNLAAQSLLGAGQASMKAGMTEDALKILQELVSSFPGSVWAMEAQKRMSQPIVEESTLAP